MGSVDKKLIYRKRKGFNDVKKFVKTVNPDLPGQVVQKGYFKEAIEEWKEGGYSAEDIQAWNLYARAIRKSVSGFNMFTRFKIDEDILSKTWERLINCNIYDVTGSGFKVDINVEGDYSGRLYIGKSKLYMQSEVSGVFSVDKYTFEVTGLSMLTNYYFYIRNSDVGKGGRTGIYSVKTSKTAPPVAIDIGNEAIDRAHGFGVDGRTTVNKNNPANESGKIKTVEMWVDSALNNVRIATFYVVSGNNLSTRGTYEHVGVIPVGYNKIEGLNMDVEAGDYIGIKATHGSMSRGSVGLVGIWYANSYYIPCINKTFIPYPNWGISLYGKGETS